MLLNKFRQQYDYTIHALLIKDKTIRKLLSRSRAPPTLFGCSAVLWNFIGSLSPSLSLSRSLGGHVWNHLVSQKTGQNDQEDKCKARSANRGERRGEGREKIDNNVQACNFKSSAQKVSQHRLRDLNFDAQIVSKCLPKGPSEILWTHLGPPLGA